MAMNKQVCNKPSEWKIHKHFADATFLFSKDFICLLETHK